MVVDFLRTRLVELVEEWPDQIVFQQLKDHCDAYLALDLKSLDDKLLSGLEEIILESADRRLGNVCLGRIRKRQGLIMGWNGHIVIIAGFGILVPAMTSHCVDCLVPTKTLVLELQQCRRRLT